MYNIEGYFKEVGQRASTPSKDDRHQVNRRCYGRSSAKIGLAAELKTEREAVDSHKQEKEEDMTPSDAQPQQVLQMGIQPPFQSSEDVHRDDLYEEAGNKPDVAFRSKKGKEKEPGCSH